MIHLMILPEGWGTDALPDGSLQLNVKDEQSGVTVTIHFPNPALEQLVREVAEKGLDQEARRNLAPLFNGGIFLPDKPVPPGFEAGPQG